MDNNRKLVIAGLILLAGIMTAMLISHYSLRQENIELSRVEDLEATRQENIDHCFREAEKVGKTRWTKHCEAYDIEIEADGNCMIDGITARLFGDDVQKAKQLCLDRYL